MTDFGEGREFRAVGEDRGDGFHGGEEGEEQGGGVGEG